MSKYKNLPLSEYTRLLSLKTPAPGGGSAAAVSGSLAVALIAMVANYSLKKELPLTVQKEIKSILKDCERLRKRFLDLIDLDAKAYLNVVKTRKSSPAIKEAALKKARAIPEEVCELCSQAIELTTYLIEHGNKYLLSDIEVAAELLLATFNAGLINIEVNQ